MAEEQPDFLSEFIQFMHDKGCPPARESDIIPDDVIRRYLVAGDKKPDARYQFTIDGDFAYGWCIYFKENETHNFHSKRKGRKFTPEEKKAWAAKREKQKREQEELQRQEYAKAAAEVQAAWKAGVEKEHPYLTKKGLPTKGTRVANLVGDDGRIQENVLLLPIWKNGKLSSLQRIWPNGFKAFWEGGDVNGGYTAFVDPDDSKDDIIIAEGYATAGACREAMGDWPVICAYTAGNLMAVAQDFRKKYPDSRIVIAADNDQWSIFGKHGIKVREQLPDGLISAKDLPGDHALWPQWRDAGFLYNTGLEKAKQAAVKIGAHVIFPDIPADDPGKNTDFDDLKDMRGLDAVRDRILVAAPANAQLDRAGGDSPAAGLPSGGDLTPPAWMQDIPPAEHGREMSYLYGNEQPSNEIAESLFDQIDDDKDRNAPWRELLAPDKEGNPKCNSLRNGGLFLKHHSRYKGMFCYDEFSQEKVITRCPPWEPKPDQFEPRTLRDEDVTELTMDLEVRGIILSVQNVKKLLDSAVMANTQNPAREYFKSLVWDGVPRLDTWLRTYAGCVSDDPQYLAAVGAKWVVAAVARIMRPGCKFDHILVFEGDQNLGKSMMLRTLATIHGREYFDDSIRAKDLSNPAIVPKLQGCLIIELAEMSGFEKMGSDEAKQVISTQYDRIIRKYANEPTKLPRQFVFAGTINPLDGYLNDPTGDRRYWPVMCTKIDIASLKRDREQLWAEAMHRWRQGEKLWLDDDCIYSKAEAEQSKRKNIHPWQFDIEKLTRSQNVITQEEIWDSLIITDRSRRGKKEQSIISGIMAGLGYKRVRRRGDNGRAFVWERDKNGQPDLLDSADADANFNSDEEVGW